MKDNKGVSPKPEAEIVTCVKAMAGRIAELERYEKIARGQLEKIKELNNKVLGLESRPISSKPVSGSAGNECEVLKPAFRA